MTVRNTLVALATSATLLVGASRASAAAYTFSNIADTTGPFAAFGARTTVNSSGTVAFAATPLGGGPITVYTSDGTGPAFAVGELGETRLDVPFTAADINDAGVVAWVARVPGDRIAYTRAGTAPPVVAARSGSQGLGLLHGVRIAPDGAIALSSGEGTERFIHLVRPGAAPVLVASHDNNLPFYTVSNRPDVNAAGDVVFYGDAEDPDTGAVTLAYYRVRNGVQTAFGRQTVFWEDAQINAAGDFVYPSSAGIVRVRGDDARYVANDTMGPFTVFHQPSGPGSTFSTPGIADDGTVVFAASLAAGGSGIFTGPDPAADRVLITGQPLFGSTLESFRYFGGVSSDGRIAFGYTLANGVTGIAVATLVPEPAAVALPAAATLLLTRRRRRRA